ncbi:MAG: HigA family addiction module antitoxin [Methylococcaceae bacterium]
MRTVPYPSPAEILIEEFLNPLHISPQDLAKAIAIPESVINEIITGQNQITADIGLRLSRYFGLSEGFWTGLQDDYNRAITKDKLQAVLMQIIPLNYANDVTELH